MKSMLRKLVLGIGVICVSGCAALQPYGGAGSGTKLAAHKATDTWSVGEIRKSGIGSYKKLLAQDNGWRIWETAGKGSYTCVAVKPASGKRWPRVSDGFGIVTGGAGFYMHHTEIINDDYFGFYGAQVYRKSTIAEVDGKIVQWTDDKDIVMSWEGKPVNFEVISGPYSHLSVDEHTDTGTIDMKGVQLAYRKMMDCVANLPADT